MKLPVTRTTIQPSQADTGALGHISNSAYVTYMQAGRTDFMAEVANQTGYSYPPLVVNLNVDFIAKSFPQNTIEVITWCSHLGIKSLKICNEIYADGNLAVKGCATCVGYNSESGTSEHLPLDWQISDYTKHFRDQKIR